MTLEPEDRLISVVEEPCPGKGRLIAFALRLLRESGWPDEAAVERAILGEAEAVCDDEDCCPKSERHDFDAFERRIMRAGLLAAIEEGPDEVTEEQAEP